MNDEIQGVKHRDEYEQPPQVEYELDLDSLPVREHKWVDRGLKLSCENAGHPSHAHFKIGLVK